MEYGWTSHTHNKRTQHVCIVAKRIRLQITDNCPLRGDITCSCDVIKGDNWSNVSFYTSSGKTVDECKEDLIQGYSQWVRDWVREEREDLAKFVNLRSWQIDSVAKAVGEE